jgi:NADH-quinone oxidoreductase subunit L
MFMAAGVGAYVAAAFHFMTHAFFKACLFLGSGSVIHAMDGEQNMDKMGGLKKHMPRTYWTFIISTLAISGIFPFAGFFSKDEILARTFGSGHTALWVIATFAAGLTAFYMFRAVFLTFHGESRVDEEVKRRLHESPNVMTLPLVVLAFLATVGGLLGIPLLKGANVMHNFLGPVFTQYQPHVVEHAAHHPVSLELKLMGLSLGVAVVGIALAWFFYLAKPRAADGMQRLFAGLHNLIYRKYYVDEIYDFLFTNPIVTVSRSFLFQIMDVRVIDAIVNGTASFFLGISRFAKGIQTGLVRDYALSMLLAFVALIGFVMWGGR